MKGKSCKYVHYINAIRYQSETKVYNFDRRGKRAFRFKSLIDIYQSEDDKRVPLDSNLQSDEEDVGFRGNPTPIESQNHLKSEDLENLGTEEDDSDGNDQDLNISMSSVLVDELDIEGYPTPISIIEDVEFEEMSDEEILQTNEMHNRALDFHFLGDSSEEDLDMDETKPLHSTFSILDKCSSLSSQDFGAANESSDELPSVQKVPASEAECSTQSQELNQKKVKGSNNDRVSRSLHISSGCNSIKECTESAIKFSQLQMAHADSIAQKALKELKSMKDIVEQKLLFESYRKHTLKNDVNEVKRALMRVAKVEETTRKGLSKMDRDCKRFCKIMKLTKTDLTASTNEVFKERKKVRFADEAGGSLCHVMFFKNNKTFPESSNAKGKDQI